MTNQNVIISDKKPILSSKTITLSVSNSLLFSNSFPTYFTFPPRKFLKLLETADNNNILVPLKITSWIDSMRDSSPTRLRSSSHDSVSDKLDITSWMVRFPSALTKFDEIMNAAKGKQIVMFLDYDGTLSPIVEDPDKAFITHEMRNVVNDVALNFPTAIVTGRSIDKVRSFVKVNEIYYAGSHGMDIEGPTTENNHGQSNERVLFQPGREFLLMIEKVVKILEEKTKWITGTMVENNKFCLSVHFRRVDEKKWAALAEVVKSVLVDYPKLKLTQGRKVLEIRPTIKWDKGQALKFLLKSLGYENCEDVVPVYIGDDRTDEDAFEMDANPVCVVPGKWKCLPDGKWEFELKAGLMAHTIFVPPCISFEELRNLIEEKFKVNHLDHNLTLSFWSPDVTKLCPREYIPPVEISTDSDVVHFQHVWSVHKDVNIVADLDDTETNCGEDIEFSWENEKMVALLEKIEADYNAKKRKRVAEDEDGVSGLKRTCYDMVPLEVGEVVATCPESESGDDDDMFNALATAVDKENSVTEVGNSGVGGRGAPYSQENELVPSSEECDADLLGFETEDRSEYQSAVERYDTSTISGSDGSYTNPLVEPIGFNLGIAGIDMDTEVNPELQQRDEEITLDVIDIDDPVFEDPPPSVEDLLPCELEEVLFVGREYDDKNKFNLSLALFALERCFCYRIYKADPSRTIALCSDPDCRWRVYAGPDKAGIKYVIKTLVNEHTCGVQYRERYREKATPKVIGELLKHHYSNGRKGPRACDIPDMLLHSHGLNIRYLKAWHAKEYALSSVRGGVENNYKLLPTYLKLLQKYNPGTITEMMKSVDSNGNTRFKYMFLAFGASISGYQYLRKVVVVDGTQLKGKYRGCLLTASCQDGNMQIFPLAFGIVDSENDKSWTWFFENLAKFVIDVDELVLISDRHSSIRYAVSRVFPNAQHCCCIIHLCRNVKVKFKCEGLASVVARAARAFTRTEFERWWHEIERRSPGCVSYLNETGFPQWSRYHCVGNRYNLMSSNIAESVNAAVKKSVDYPIITMIEYARTLLMSWFYSRRELSNSSSQHCTPQVESLLVHNIDKSRHLLVRPASSTIFSVSEADGRVQIVDLENKTCTCMVFNCFKIPCPHALAACSFSNGKLYDLVDRYYHRDVWASIYEKLIMPVPNIDDHGREVIENIQPPITRRPPGRPPNARIPSAGETPNNGPYRSPRCGRCGLPGHNKSTCKSPLS